MCSVWAAVQPQRLRRLRARRQGRFSVSAPVNGFASYPAYITTLHLHVKFDLGTTPRSMLQCRAQVWFGRHDWDMPPAPHRNPVLAERCAVFAAALLSGQVLPTMSQLTPHLAAPPATACQPQGRAQPRVGELLAALVSRKVRAAMTCRRRASSCGEG